MYILEIWRMNYILNIFILLKYIYKVLFKNLNNGSDIFLE